MEEEEQVDGVRNGRGGEHKIGRKWRNGGRREGGRERGRKGGKEWWREGVEEGRGGGGRGRWKTLE